MKKIFLILILTISLSSCQSESEGVLDETRVISKLFIKDLKQVHSRADALKLKAIFRKHYRKYAQLMIEAKQLEEDAPDSFIYLPLSANVDELRSELQRVYHIQGVRSVLEESQKEALYDLYLSNIIR